MRSSSSSLAASEVAVVAHRPGRPHPGRHTRPAPAGGELALREAALTAGFGAVARPEGQDLVTHDHTGTLLLREDAPDDAFGRPEPAVPRYASSCSTSCRRRPSTEDVTWKASRRSPKVFASTWPTAAAPTATSWSTRTAPFPRPSARQRGRTGAHRRQRDPARDPGHRPTPSPRSRRARRRYAWSWSPWDPVSGVTLLGDAAHAVRRGGREPGDAKRRPPPIALVSRRDTWPPARPRRRGTRRRTWRSSCRRAAPRGAGADVVLGAADVSAGA